MSVYFVLKLIIFMMMKRINDICYFGLKMLIWMMGSTNDVSFFCLIFFTLYILLLYQIYRQYLVKYIIFICIR